MNRLLLALVVTSSLALLAAGCPSLLAPATTEGDGAGAACSSSWSCQAGLACECGQCAEPTGRPVRCPSVDDECSDDPSPCYASCGDREVVGDAACVNDRESCGPVGGVLEAQCPDDTCWGEAEPGELCVDGRFVCEFGRSTETGHCYTFDCDDETQGACVASCGGPAPFAQVCLGGEWRCETGLPVEECGECVGAPPSCVRDCDDLSPVGAAACQALAWSCSHLSLPDAGPLVVADECCLPELELREPADLAALDEVSCVTGALGVLTGSLVEVELSGLTSVGDLLVSSDVLERFAAPQLEQVTRVLSVEENPALQAFEAPSLRRVGTGFSFRENPRLSVCDILELREQVNDGGPLAIEDISGNGPCLDDAGTTDAGPPGDGGEADAGDPSDAGPADGGSTDAG